MKFRHQPADSRFASGGKSPDTFGITQSSRDIVEIKPEQFSVSVVIITEATAGENEHAN